MKKMTSLLLSLLTVIGLFLPATAVFADEDPYFSDEQIAYYEGLGLQGTSINVYNWGEYIADGSEGTMDAVGEFERLTAQELIIPTLNRMRICTPSLRAAVFRTTSLFRPTI